MMRDQILEPLPEGQYAVLGLCRSMIKREQSLIVQNYHQIAKGPVGIFVVISPQ